MKTHKNLYEKICSFKNLHKAFKKAKKTKSKKDYVIKFESNIMQNLLQLKHELETQSYKTKPLKTFVIRDPKTRVISASDFRDRIVHHAICNIIEPIFERTFIHDSYANRKNKGTHKALQRFDYFKSKITKNGRLVKDPKSNNMIIGYALKCDIKQYFASVDHEIIIQLIKKKIKDKKLLWLITLIIKNHATKEPGKGMPIGNLTSQYFANIYLNQLDYFVKQKLKAKYYIRYLDDFIILDRSKQKLDGYKKQISQFLKTIKLEPHPDKSKIIPLHKGINLLGFRIFYHNKLLKKSNIRLIEYRVKNFKKLHNSGQLPKNKIAESIQSWCAYAKWANTHKLRKGIEKQIDLSLKDNIQTMGP